MAAKFNTITGDRWEEILKYFPKYTEGMVQTEPGRFTLPTSFKGIANDLANFPFDPSDIIIHGFPKSGTTWIQDMVWVLQNNMDFEGVKKFGQRIWIPEFWCLATEEERQRTLNQIEKVAPGTSKLSAFNMKPLDIVEHVKAPRVFKTHVPFYLLNPKAMDTCKVIYVARNPKDNCVSYYHHHKAMSYCEYNGDFEKFVDFYIRGEVQYAPYWEHVKEAYNLSKTHPNMLFLTYEDLKKDLKSGIRKIAEHLGKKVSEDDIQKIHDHFTVKRFQGKAATDTGMKKVGIMKEDATFVRKGVAGDWQNHFKGDLNKRFDEWIQENSKDLDLKFEYGHIE